MNVSDLYMAKIAFNPEGNRIFVIGGAKDSKSKQTVNTCNGYHVTHDRITEEHMNPMIDSRASFGCLYCPR